MNLSEKAVLLGQLGKLMRCLAFTQTQFERVKTLILNGDPRVTVELFSTLTAFREQRAAGILTDQEYNDLVSEGLEDLMVDLDPSSTDAPTTVSSSYQASKRKVSPMPPLGSYLPRYLAREEGTRRISIILQGPMP